MLGREIQGQSKLITHFDNWLIVSCSIRFFFCGNNIECKFYMFVDISVALEHSRDLKILYHHISLNFYRKRTCVKELLESFIIPNMQKIKMISAKKKTIIISHLKIPENKRIYRMFNCKQCSKRWTSFCKWFQIREPKCKFLRARSVSYRWKWLIW